MKKTKDEALKNEDNIREVIVERKTGFNIIEVIIIIIISIVFGIIVGRFINIGKGGSISKYSSGDLSEFINTYYNIVDNYYESVDKDKLINAAIEGMVNSLGDKHSLYMNEKETEAFEETVDGQYVGIGAIVSNIDGSNQILGMFSKSPAEKAGLQVGDIFLKVDDKDVSNLKIDEVTTLIKGEEGTSVNIVISRNGEELSFDIVRESIDIPSVVSEIIESDNSKIGYVTISNFASNTYSQFNKEIKDLEKKNIDSLVIDLRNNPGGHLDQVTKMISMFLPKSKVIYQLYNKGIKTPVYSKTNEKRSYPVAIIINGGSASASEIMAASFKESYKNSYIVGTKSYGKGTVQHFYDLSSGASFKFTVEEWLSPLGNSIDGNGITPDFEIELDEGYYSNPVKENDNQLQKALEVLKEKK